MTSVTLPAIFDLAAASQVADRLRGAAEPLPLDGEQVERIGVAGLQLLLSAHATAAAQGKAQTIERASASLRDAVRTIGADYLLASAR